MFIFLRKQLGFSQIGKKISVVMLLIKKHALKHENINSIIIGDSIVAGFSQYILTFDKTFFVTDS